MDATSVSHARDEKSWRGGVIWLPYFVAARSEAGPPRAMDLKILIMPLRAFAKGELCGADSTLVAYHGRHGARLSIANNVTTPSADLEVVRF